MATKHYLLTDYDTSIGVIKIEDGNFDIDKLKSIIEEYTDLSIIDVKIDHYHSNEGFEINYIEEETGEENRIAGETVQIFF